MASQSPNMRRTHRRERVRWKSGRGEVRGFKGPSSGIKFLAPIAVSFFFCSLAEIPKPGCWCKIMCETEQRSGDFNNILIYKLTEKTQCFEKWFREKSLFCSDKFRLCEIPDHEGNYRGACMCFPWSFVTENLVQLSLCRCSYTLCCSCG